MARTSTENFPVAPRLLGGRLRRPLLAIYGFARLADELGDAADGDRLALLDWLEAEYERARRGRATHPVLVRLEETLQDIALPDAPFRRLIEANRRDQRVSRYATFEELRDYCTLSANPVGHLVLAAFGADTSERRELSDAICTGLQLLEHIGDVAEDARAGRVYLPAWDLARFGVHPEDLLGPPAGPAVVALLRFEIERAARWLRQGSALVGTLHGAPRAAVAGFVAGGLAAADAVRAAGGAVLAGAPRPSRVALARHFAVIVTRGAARGAAR